MIDLKNKIEWLKCSAGQQWSDSKQRCLGEPIKLDQAEIKEANRQLNEQIEKMNNYSLIAGERAIPNGVQIDGWFQVENTILGDGRKWDQVRFNTFPSRRAFQEVLDDPARMEAQKKYREVAISDSYTMIVTPLINRVSDSI